MAAAVLTGFDSVTAADGGEGVVGPSSQADTSSMPSRSPANDSPGGPQKGGRVAQHDAANDDAASYGSSGSPSRSPMLSTAGVDSRGAYAPAAQGRGATTYTDSEADSGGGARAAEPVAPAAMSAGETLGATAASSQAAGGDDGGQPVPVTTLEFRPTYLLGGLCTPPPPRFAAQYPTILRYRVSQDEFDNQIDKLSAFLAVTHNSIRRARVVPIGFILLGVIMCVLAVVVALTSDDDSAPLWPVLVGVPLLTVGVLGVWLVGCRTQSLIDDCVRALEAHVERLNQRVYEAAGMRWVVSAHAMMVKRNGRRTSVQLPMVELQVEFQAHTSYAYLNGSGDVGMAFPADHTAASDDDVLANAPTLLARNPLAAPAFPMHSDSDVDSSV